MNVVHALLQYGIWDQVCVDQGSGVSYTATTLTNDDNLLFAFLPKNHFVERMWVEINGRVNYPVKECLVTLEERGMSTWIACTKNFAFRGFQSVLQMLGLPSQFRHGMLIEYEVQQIDNYFGMSIFIIFYT